MKLSIDDSKKIIELQEQFNGVFPFLKIEFFRKSHSAGEASPVGEMLPHDANLSEWRTNHAEGSMEITAESTVEELENGFQERFGISAQVFRKSGKVWLETSVTDSWTLAEQNERGREMSQGIG